MTPGAREIALPHKVCIANGCIAPDNTLDGAGPCEHYGCWLVLALLYHGDAKIEEAAKVAERFGFPGQHDFPKIIATEIRALKSAPVNPAEQETERE